MPKAVIPRWRIGDAHKNNCCAVHGCKWSEKDCPVVAGTVRPGPCQICLGIKPAIMNGKKTFFVMQSPEQMKYAYEAATRALWKHREGEEKLAEKVLVMAAKILELRNEIRLLKKRAAAAIRRRK